MSDELEDAFRAGKRAGKIESIDRILQSHSTKIEKIEDSIRMQERVAYMLIGAIAFIEIWPALKGVLH